MGVIICHDAVATLVAYFSSGANITLLGFEGHGVCTPESAAGIERQAGLEAGDKCSERQLRRRCAACDRKILCTLLPRKHP